MFQKYRKKVEIDAWQFTGDIPDDLIMAIRRVPDGFSSHQVYQVYDALHFTWINFEVGDYIVRGVQGELYPVKEDVFKETYEAVAYD